MSLELEEKLSMLKFLSELSESDKKKSTEFNIENEESYVDTLKSTYTLYLNKEEKKISVGDIVEWKKGLRNRKKPLYREPAIVLDILNTPIFDDDESSGSPYYKEELNLILGILDEENDMQKFYYDVKRFKIYDYNSEKDVKEICQ